MKNYVMKILLYICLIMCFMFKPALAVVMQGGVSQSELIKKNRVIDKYTKQPIPNARIDIPSKNYSIYSDDNGEFVLSIPITTPTILSVDKENYKPFSITITRDNSYNPFVLSIEQSSKFDIKIDSQLCHLGDNNFSTHSANAGQFRGLAVGPVYNKEFVISASQMNKQNYLIIGSIIGIDTAMARGLGQNTITSSFASPPNVYLNGQKIAEIQINGDNQKIRLPKNLIRFNQKNIITIKAGQNLMQTAYVDYDDIEFINISIQAY